MQVEPLEAGGWRDGAGRLVAAMGLLEYQSFDPINVGLKVDIGMEEKLILATI